MSSSHLDVLFTNGFQAFVVQYRRCDADNKKHHQDQQQHAHSVLIDQHAAKERPDHSAARRRTVDESLVKPFFPLRRKLIGNGRNGRPDKHFSDG